MAGSPRVERPFVGRPEAVDALRRRSDAVRLGRGGLTVIEGEAGVGKSTLVAGLLADARLKGLRTLFARPTGSDNPPPFQLLKEALGRGETAEVLGEGPSGPSSLAFAPTAFDAAHGLSGRPLVGPESWLLDESPIGGVVPGAAPGSRERPDRYLAHRLLELGDAAPTTVVLEDVHLADDGSLDALDTLAPLLETHPLWVVLTRLPLAAIPGPRRARLEAIERATEVEHVRVRPFTPSEAEEFVRAVAGEATVSPEEVTRWQSQSGGNPAFLEQLVRRRDRLSHHPPVPGADQAPEFTEYLARQLSALLAPEERVLAVGSVLGRDFSFSLLLRASGEEEESLAELVQELVGRGILREGTDEGLSFAQDALRHHVYERLTEARRRLLHRRAAEALEAGAPADVATIYALARHCYLGRVDDAAVTYNRLAAEFAARSHAPTVAREHLERAREVLARLRPRDPVAELEVAVELAVQLDVLGQLDAAENLLKTTLASVEGLDGPSQALRSFASVCLARIYADQGRWDVVDRITVALLAEGSEAAGPRTLLAVYRLRGEYLYYRGRYPESLEAHDRALAIARAQPDTREVALERVRRANVLGMVSGRFDEAVRDYREVTAELLARGDKSEAAYAELFLGVVLSQHGRTEEGLEALRAARGHADEAQDPRRLGWALFNIADLERDRGNLDAARAAMEEARVLLERTGDRYGLVQTLIVDGKIRLQSNELPEAELALLEAYRLARELNVPADEVEVLLRLAELALARSDRGQAEARARELERLGVATLRPDLVRDYEAFRARLAGRGEHPAA